MISPYGYGSIPIDTIFSGMNIHLPAILMFIRGTRFWHTAISWNSYLPQLISKPWWPHSVNRLRCFWVSWTCWLWEFRTQQPGAARPDYQFLTCLVVYMKKLTGLFSFGVGTLLLLHPWNMQRWGNFLSTSAMRFCKVTSTSTSSGWNCRSTAGGGSGDG